jgi:hypothetical protein
MPVQIVITGEHATDALAELQNLSDALRAELQNLSTALNASVEHTVSADFPRREAPKPEAPAEDETKEKPKVAPKVEKLSRIEQEKAMKEMIEAGEKDERFGLLTKVRAAKVEKALEAADEVDESSEKDEGLSGMFDDEDDDAPEEVTSDMVREMMANLGKDEDGNPIQDNLLKIREILTKFVPKGEEVKVGKIPADKLADVYEALQEMEDQDGFSRCRL